MNVTCTAYFFESYSRSLQLPLIKMWDPLLQNFPQQNFECTDLLNRSFWFVRDLGNMESVLINSQAYVSSQVSFTVQKTGQVIVPAHDLWLRPMSLCHGTWCHLDLNFFNSDCKLMRSLIVKTYLDAC